MGRPAVVVDPAKVEAAVGKVLDPHINVPLTEMGMLSDITLDDCGSVAVSLVLPCMGCPAFTMLKENVRRQVERVDGVKEVRVKFDWNAKWDRSLMSERAKEYAAKSGYRI
jgi:metal-sulfur cluster biosynthetic enzyme